MGAINRYRDQIVIILLGLVFFFPFLGGAHLFDWDEINFAEAAREMIVTGDYFTMQINYQPFWEKPPLFIWMQVLAMKIFGVNELAARLPNAVCGIATLLVLFRLGKHLHGRSFGWIWVMAYLGSILPHLYFRSGIIDPWFNLLIFGSLAVLILAFSNRENSGQVKRYGNLVFGGVLLGLAVLTKGPVAILIIGLTGLIYWGWRRFELFFKISEILVYTAAALMVILMWFGVEWWMNGSWFIREFLAYQIRLLSTADAGHGGFPGYHFVVLLIGCFPASIFAIPALYKAPPLFKDAPQDFRKWMLVLFWVVLILFSIVQSKIVHYSSLCYFPLTYLAATYVFSFTEKNQRLPAVLSNALIALGSLLGLIVLAVPFIGKNIHLLREELRHDPFAWSNLGADVHWSYWAIIPGLILLDAVWTSSFIFKKRNFGTLFSIRQGFFILLGGTALFIASSLYFFINKIEGYSQNAAISFYQSLEGEAAYVTTVGFKSYAHLFYFKKPPPEKAESYDENWLMRGAIDRDVYFVTKIHKVHIFDDLVDVERIGEKNGFVFFVRRGVGSR